MNAAHLIASTVLALATITPAQAAEAFDPLDTVEYVDLDRYVGSWYEIATIPAIFEWGCNGTTATYTANDDGTIGVLNSCNMFWLNGPVRDAQAVATVADPETNAKLKVKFGGSPVAGDYWVIDLDAEGYQWAVVGEPTRSYYWILSRRPVMDPDLYQELLDRAADVGYDVSQIEETKQTRR